MWRILATHRLPFTKVRSSTRTPTRTIRPRLHQDLQRSTTNSFLRLHLPKPKTSRIKTESWTTTRLQRTLGKITSLRYSSTRRTHHKSQSYRGTITRRPISLALSLRTIKRSKSFSNKMQVVICLELKVHLASRSTSTRIQTAPSSWFHRETPSWPVDRGSLWTAVWEIQAVKTDWSLVTWFSRTLPG